MMDLKAFVRESNKIEGIVRVTDAEVLAHAEFLSMPPSLPSLARLVSVLQPDARLRDRVGLDVRVGPHVPPPGGPEIKEELIAILREAVSAYDTHQAYETLHPFTDGNGRSGRALWLHMMGGYAPLGFLHHWYYQSLQNNRSA